MLYVLFGKAGSGKSYVADILAKEQGLYLYKPDDDIPPAIKNAIEKKELFTDGIRDEYVAIIKTKLKHIMQQHPDVVMPQALFKNKQRHDLKRAFSQARFVWVDAPDALIEKRLAHRERGIPYEYVKMINPHFEEPDFECYRIDNTGDDENVRMQLKTMTQL